MKKTLKALHFLTLISFAVMAIMLSGCVTGKGWQGLIPDKDVDMINPIVTVMTPYGQQTLRADRISTRVNPAGTNPLAPLPQPNQNVVTVAISTNTPVVELVPAASKPSVTPAPAAAP